MSYANLDTERFNEYGDDRLGIIKKGNQITFEEWYQTDRNINLGKGTDNYFNTIIENGCIQDHIDIKIYMQLAWDAALQQKETN